MLGKPSNVVFRNLLDDDGSWKKPRFFQEAKAPGKRLTDLWEWGAPTAKGSSLLSFNR
jgi:hypothetical protein